MNKVVKIGMIVWTILCAIGTCVGIVSVSNQGHLKSDAGTAGAAIGIVIWMLIWGIPMGVMGIIYIATKKKT